MEMRVDAQRIRSEREKRAWSQEHLAQVSGLGVRTIHRIEKTGNASLESIKSLAAVFELEAAALQTAIDPTGIAGYQTWPGLLWLLLKSPVKLTSSTDSRKTNFLRWLSMFGCLAGAAASYSLGFSSGIALFVIVGVLFEIGLWFKLIEIARSSPPES